MEDNQRVDALYRVQEGLKELKHSRGMTWRKIAARPEYLGLSHATLRDIAVTGRASRSTRRKLGLPPERTRIAADVTAAQRDALHALAAKRGLTWSELCRALADGELKPAWFEQHPDQ